MSIYFPVWVDQFGPKTTKTIMMAFIQVASPLGIVIGYAMTKGIVMGGSNVIILNFSGSFHLLFKRSYY